MLLVVEIDYENDYQLQRQVQPTEFYIMKLQSLGAVALLFLFTAGGLVGCGDDHDHDDHDHSDTTDMWTR